MRRVVVGLGSNLGDRAATIARSIEVLSEQEQISVAGRSHLYESPPLGGPPQGDYLNGAVLLRTTLTASELMNVLLSIEKQLGRSRPDAVRWGPRSIDLDLLWIEGEWSDSPDVLVPHPGLTTRPFALQPLLELVPEAADPRTGAKYAGLDAALSPMRRIS